MKEYNYVIAIIDFVLAIFNIYWLITHDSPISLVAGAMCFTGGIIALMTNKE